jgi:hypothetical protein
MNTWYSKHLGTFRTAFGALNEIQQAFIACYMASGRSNGVAVFVKYHPDQDSVTVYLTPESNVLAGKLDAVACTAPATGATLVIGDRDAYERYFGSVPDARADRACNEVV